MTGQTVARGNNVPGNKKAALRGSRLFRGVVQGKR